MLHFKITYFWIDQCLAFVFQRHEFQRQNGHTNLNVEKTLLFMEIIIISNVFIDVSAIELVISLLFYLIYQLTFNEYRIAKSIEKLKKSLTNQTASVLYSRINRAPSQAGIVNFALGANIPDDINALHRTCANDRPLFTRVIVELGIIIETWSLPLEPSCGRWSCATDYRRTAPWPALYGDLIFLWPTTSRPRRLRLSATRWDNHRPLL